MAQPLDVAPAGDPVAGLARAAALGCNACHVVPGIRGPVGHVGPSLVGFAARGYIAGILPNTADNLVLWLRDPPAIMPRTAMPDLDLEEASIRDIAAFLATLR